MRKKRPKKSPGRTMLRTAALWALLLTATLAGFAVLQVLSTRFVNPVITLPMVIEWVTADSGADRKLHAVEWRELDQIGDQLQKAVLAGEDQRFYAHNGFDMVELSNALDDAVAGRGVRGASTITMQTARTVFLWRGRHLTRKLLEAYYTFLLEAIWPKARILEVYLNTVDWGDRIWGAQAAARAYFRVEPSGLTKGQAAWLATILPNPHKWSPSRPTPYLKERQRRIRRDMARMPIAPLKGST